MTKEALMQMLNDEINAGLKTALTRVNALVAENKALKEALAQPEKGLFIDLIAQHEGLADEMAQPEQEHKHIVQSNGKYSPLLTHMMSKRTTPPKRPWVGLTDEDIAYAYTLEKKFAMQYVDAKLKEKNT